VNTLVVICHPLPTSLTRVAFGRVITGLERAGHDYRVIDLDAIEFDPRLTEAEKVGHLDPPETKPEVANHVADLRWAERLVLVYPTWFGGFPARLKGWFDRTWITGVAYHLPDGADRIRPGLRNIKRFDVITTHGSSRWLNLVQGNPGRLTVTRMLRALCHPLCRTRIMSIYGLDDADPRAIEAWLDRIEARYSR
jgi:putative NADPH-quinone reductase